MTPAARLARMKQLALALLLAAAAVYGAATALEHRHPAWGYVAAFAEAAMVGAIADWFAVVALFRHPMGLPIPHTAIIPRGKDRIGANLADFLCSHFLATPQVLAKLAQFDPAGRLAGWLRRPEQAARLGAQGVALARASLAAFDDDRVREFVRTSAGAALAQLDTTRLAGRVLEALTAEGRHQALLDEALRHVAHALDSDTVQEQITDAIAREVKALRFVGLDQVAARMATRKIVAAAAHTVAELAAPTAPGAEPHPLRLRFDAAAAEAIARLQTDPAWQTRGAQWQAELLAHPALGAWLHGLWGDLLAWLQTDLARPDSTVGARIAALAQTLGERLAEDSAMRGWINAQITAAAPALIERYREDIRGYVVERVAAWDADELTTELERAIGRDLQFIRINGTLVGGLVGLTIHAATQALR